MVLNAAQQRAADRASGKLVYNSTTGKLDPVKTQNTMIDTTPPQKPQVANINLGDTPANTQKPVSINIADKPSVLLSSGQKISENFNTQFDDTLDFGEKAKLKETTTPGYINKRNDYLAQDFFSKNAGLTQDQVDTKLREYLSSKGIQGDESDINNTIKAISNRIQGIPEKSELETKIADIDSEYKTQKDALLKAGAVDTRFTNFNEVDKEVNNILSVAGEDRANKNYTGMPTDKDLLDIANKTGSTVERVKQILTGKGYETLEQNPEFQSETDLQYNRNIKDLDKEVKRKQEDLDREYAQTKQNIQQQQQDILEESKKNIDAMNMIGALRGYTNTTGFIQGINGVHDEAIKTVNRLETQLQQASNATEEQKGRLLADYNTALARAKEDLDTQTKQINNELGVKYSTYLQQYTGETLLKKLKDLNNSAIDAKLEATNKYVQSLSSVNQTTNMSIDNLMRYDGIIKGKTTENYNKLTANNGELLANYSVNDLQQMYKKGAISVDQYKTLQTTLLEKARTTLEQYGTPAATDYKELTKLMAEGASAGEALKQVVLSGGERFKKAKKELLGTGGGSGSGNGSGGATGTNEVFEGIKNGLYAAEDLNTSKVQKLLGIKGKTSIEKKNAIISSFLDYNGKENLGEAINNLKGVYTTEKDKGLIIKGAVNKFGIADVGTEIINKKTSTKEMVKDLGVVFQGKTPNKEWLKKKLSDQGYKRGDINTVYDALTSLPGVKKQ